MKFTKRAYVKVWQNCPIDDREDTTITLLDYEDANELNSIPVALLYLLERHAFVDSMDEFNTLECCLTAESFDLIGFVKTYRDMLSKTGDFWTPMKFITASPKPVDGIPPVSYCPRCGALIWPDTTQRCINGQPEKRRRILPTNPRNLQEQPRPALLPQLRATLQIRRPRPTSLQAPKQPRRHPTHPQTQGGNPTNVRSGRGQPMIGEPLSFSLFIPGIPASKGSYRPITGRSRTTGKPVTRLIPMDKKERPWRDHVRDTILSHKHPTIPPNSYVTVETTFYLPRPKTIPPHKRKHPTVKPDIDKLQRALYDAITETHIWHDDCQITDVTSHKRYADNTTTGVSLTITWKPNQ